MSTRFGGDGQRPGVAQQVAVGVVAWSVPLHLPGFQTRGEPAELRRRWRRCGARRYRLAAVGHARPGSTVLVASGRARWWITIWVSGPPSAGV